MGVLTCTKCGYELTGLIRGRWPVRCPECGVETRHINGSPVPRQRIWKVLGAGRLSVAILIPLSVAAIPFALVSRPMLRLSQQGQQSLIEWVAWIAVAAAIVGWGWILSARRPAGYSRGRWNCVLIASCGLSILASALMFAGAVLVIVASALGSG